MLHETNKRMLSDWFSAALQTSRKCGREIYMEVIDHLPHGWFLFKKENNLFIDVNCSYSAFSYSMLVRLLENEKEAYERSGHDWATKFAQDIQQQGLGKYKERNIHKEFENEVSNAISNWRNSSSIT